ncbi:MAG: DegT/DnrJ/EryC1/StrS family aminotransferase [Pseudomonadales bacterium]|nr:DegT/DnrJ/EryC1/StrS family aminotransferase [Pseudomonadales bacterium]MDG2079255.1 DegT/DnrJ/EryC1/StrS family aminotransferase [Pseudomonadales bacterium]
MRKLFGRIPPAGNPITIKTSHEVPVLPGSLKTYFLNSGTAALAAGLQIAQQHCKAKKPEVIIPAYCCPDLLSAILYNDMKPVLVDFIPDKPYMDLNGIEEALNENTVAVIAVNFLGIPERFKEIKQLLQDMPTLLIEDSCQWFPESDEAFASHEGDLVVYSFGKGKPVCVLGGGALSIVGATYQAYAPTGDITPEHKRTSIAQAMFNRVKYLAYNFVLTPYAYWLLEVMPFIKLGETRFHPLTSITAMPTDKLIFLKHNIESYEQRYKNRDSEWQHVTKNPSKNSVAILHNQCPTYKKQQLLRLPLLCDDPYLRNEFYALSENRGFGGSKLYADILPKVLDMPCSLIADSAIVNAVDFSKRLLTLPTHSNADEKITLYYEQRP